MPRQLRSPFGGMAVALWAWGDREFELPSPVRRLPDHLSLMERSGVVCGRLAQHYRGWTRLIPKMSTGRVLSSQATGREVPVLSIRERIKVRVSLRSRFKHKHHLGSAYGFSGKRESSNPNHQAPGNIQYPNAKSSTAAANLMLEAWCFHGVW